MAEEEDESIESVSDEDICDEEFEGDTWIEELECALLADCDPATLKKISEGKRIPATLRPDYWRALLALNDAGKFKLTSEYDLENQLEIRSDCEKLVEDIETILAKDGRQLSEADKLKLKSNYESTLTTYIKARPELSYVSDNGWMDILKVLYHLELSDTQLYQMFFRIVDRYIPKDLSTKQSTLVIKKADTTSKLDSQKSTLAPANSKSFETIGNTTSAARDKTGTSSPKAIAKSSTTTGHNLVDKSGDSSVKRGKESIQAYHLLRLLIQYHDPELCSILDSKKITPNLYVKDWFCSLFARSCAPQLALSIWDTHFKMADPFLIFFAAIVMVVNASDELKKSNKSQAEMLDVLKSMPGKLEEDDIDDLYYLVSHHYTNSTPRSIRSYSHLFFMDTFGNTYQGNDSPEDGQPMLDLKTSQLTSSLDLSHYLCLPIVPAEIFAIDTAQQRSSPTHTASSLRYFLVDCRPAEQYNAGHLTKAFHLDCSLMLREPSSFATAVQALLEIQRQVVESKSNTGGQHLCFIGSGPGGEEEDQYVNMVVASFLQKYLKYVSIVVGGFDAIHDYVSSKSELRDSFSKYIVDHNEDLCKPCYLRCPEKIDRNQARGSPNIASNQTPLSGFSSAQSLFASTTSFLRGDKGAHALASSTLSNLAQSNPQATATANLIAQSGASMFDKLTTFVSKSSVIKDHLVETLNTTAIPSPRMTSGASTGRGHVSSQDKLGRRYTGSNLKYAIDENDYDDLSNRAGSAKDGSISRDTSGAEPVQEIQIDVWQRQTKVLAFYKCAQLKGNAKYPGYIALTKTHLWILREIPHNKGFASIAAKRPLDMIVQITSKRRQPDLIIFRYGYANQSQQSSPVPANENSSNGGGESSSLPTTTPKREGGMVLPSIVASDHLHIPQAFEVIRLIKREIVRIMDESSRLREATSRTVVDLPGVTTSSSETSATGATLIQDPKPEPAKAGTSDESSGAKEHPQ